MKPLYIFDLDGTVADATHRQHLLTDRNDPTCWRDYYVACELDAPIYPVISTLNRLLISSDVWIFTGRSDEARESTLWWLRENTSLVSVSNELTMRVEGDRTPDHILKKRWLDWMLPEDRNRLVAVFEDRDRVVQMWRDNGIQCFQVQPGAF